MDYPAQKLILFGSIGARRYSYLHIGRQSPGATLIMHDYFIIDRSYLYCVAPRLQPSKDVSEGPSLAKSQLSHFLDLICEVHIAVSTVSA